MAELRTMVIDRARLVGAAPATRPRTILVSALALVLSIWTLSSFPSAPEVIFERTTSDGIGVLLRWAPLETLSGMSLGTFCDGHRQLELAVKDRSDPRGANSGQSVIFAYVDELRVDPAGLMRVSSWAGGAPSGEITHAFALARVGRTVARVRAFLPDGGTDEMVPLDGWAAIAIRLRTAAFDLRTGTIQGLDASGRVIATVDSSSLRRTGCLQEPIG